MKVATLLMTGTILIGSVGIALAQPAGGTPPGGGGGRGGGLRTACADDMTKLCAGKTGPDMRTCLTDNKDKVSATCKTALDAPRPAGPPPGQ